MTFSDLWYRVDAALIVFTFLLVLLLVAELGFRKGLKRMTDAMISKSDVVQQGLLTLLALLLAFGVSMAELRFEERNSILIDETTAIGTTYLRGALFGLTFQKRFQNLLKQYVDTRINWYRIGHDHPALTANQKRTEELQASLWSEVSDLSRDKPTVTMSLLLGSLNQTFDLQAKQEFAYARRVPRSIVYLLFLISTLVVAMVGYSHGLTGTRHLVFTTMMSIVLALTLFVILDLSRAERGLIRLDPEVLVNLRQSLDKR